MGGGGAGKRKTRAAGEEGVDADDDAENLALQVVAQKPKTGGDDRSAVSIVGVPTQQPHPKKGMNRTSSLDAPIMLLAARPRSTRPSCCWRATAMRSTPSSSLRTAPRWHRAARIRRCSCGTFAATARCADPPPIDRSPVPIRDETLLFFAPTLAPDRETRRVRRTT